jgi:hypothetical protein
MNLFLRYIPLGLLTWLLWVLVRRRAYLLCPWFFAYSAFGVAAGVARFVAHNGLGASYYYLTYWTTEAGYDILGILVMYEAFRSALGTLTRIRRTHFVFIFAGVLIFGLCMALARTRTTTPHIDTIPSYILTGEIAVRFVQVVVFAGLVTLVLVLGLRWRQYSFGIATGFGLYATVMLLTTTKFSDFGTRFKLLWAWTSLVAYSVAVLIWIWFFSVPQKIESSSSTLSAPSPGDLKQYKDALRRMR